MKKFAYFLLAAVALAFSVGASAADNVKGTDISGYPSMVGLNVIPLAKNVGGVLYYTTSFNGTPRQLSDSSGAQYAKVVAHFGANGFVATNGYLYHLGRVTVSCQGTNSVIQIHGHNGIETLSDNCASYNTANAK